MTEINLFLVSLSILLFSSSCQPQNGVFDVTNYGAKPNTDISQALLNAWKDGCAFKNMESKVVIPKETYKLNAVKLEGPCKSPIKLEVQGVLQAPPSLTGQGWLSFEYINQLTVAGGGVFDGQAKMASDNNDCDNGPDCINFPITLRFDYITNSIVSDITSKDSKSFHINVLACNNVTFRNLNIKSPKNGLNIDGIHVERSEMINITSANIETGDECISIGDGIKQVTISNVTCGLGHGISVGNLGEYEGEERVEGIFVKNCTLRNTDSGIRIKTRPNSYSPVKAKDMHFEDIQMMNVTNPILIDQEYCPDMKQCEREIPSKVKISKVSFKNIRGSSANANAIKLVCSSTFPCRGVEVIDIDLTYSGKDGPIYSDCKNVVKPVVSGKQNPVACSAIAPHRSP